jgi:hypothetical protein
MSGIAGYGRAAYAACDVTTSPTYLCSGTNTDPLVINADNATVSTLPGFSVDSTGIAIRITGGGNISFTDANRSSIAGADTGLYIEGTGSGSVTVDVTGDVTGSAFHGVYARNNTGGTSLTVTTGADSSVSSAGYGIKARNDGTGALRVEANGEVTASLINDGIFAFNSNLNNTGGLSVTTGVDSIINGARHGITATNNGTGALSIEVNGDVTTTNNNGIDAANTNVNNTGGMSVKTGAGSVINANWYGMYVYHRGNVGDLIVEANGNVTGNRYDGIKAGMFSDNSTGELKVTTGAGSAITGGNSGIYATNYGKGALTIDVSGDVRGGTGDGIRARNFNLGTTANLSVTTAAGTSVTGAQRGILAENYGTGGVTVEANGTVIGATNEGIRATTSIGGTGELRVTTGASSEVEGSHGILAENSGIGGLTVEANGAVTGTSYNGISAKSFNTAPSAAMTVSTGAGSDVHGVYNGIYARQYGEGNLTVTADGMVEGNSYHGIYARMTINDSTGDLKVTTGAGASITGGRHGIFAQNSGQGALIVEANGDVTGNGEAGIRAINYNSENTGGLRVRTGAGSAVEGGTFGISALNEGTGALIVEANGDVTGILDEGIYARSSDVNNASEFRVTMGAGSVVTGARYGISASNQGQSVLRVEANGVVKGGTAAIYAAASANAPSISITVGGVVQNTSGLASDMAIMASRAEVVLDNGGVITGRVALSDLDDILTNTETWNVAGDSEFGGGDDEVRNGGLIKAGGTEDVADATSFIDLELLHNSGTISMVDQVAGDGSNISDTLIVRADYEGNGGTLAVDAFLGGPGSLADVMVATEDVFGTTYVVINDTNDGFATFNPDGILVVAVEGPAVPSNFMLADGPVSNGLYSYDLVQEFDPINTREVFLLKNFAGLHVFEVAAAVSGAQNIFFDTASAWSDRQDQLRDWQASRSQVVAVADPPLPEEGTNNGLWLSVRGVNSEREASDTTEALGNRYTFDTGYDQTTFSVLGGADFGVDLDSGTLLFGALGGYFSSNQELNSSDTEIDYEGGSLGAYATYLNGGFFAGVLGKADFYTVDYDAAGPGDNSDRASGQNLGLRADAGYRFGMGGGMYLEPVASLAAVWTDIDDFALYNTTAQPGSNDALQLGGGARFGWEAAALDLSLTGRVWEVVNDGNDVGVIVPDTTLTSVTDTSFDGTFGEVSGKMGYSISERASILFAGSYLFSDAQQTLSGTAGVSYSW